MTTILHKLSAAAILLAATIIVPACTMQETSAIPVACNAVQNGLAAAAIVAKGGAAQTVAQAQATAAASCTAAGQAALAANDAAPVSPTNSGNSAGWLTSLLTDAEAAAKIAVVVAPLL